MRRVRGALTMGRCRRGEALASRPCSTRLLTVCLVGAAWVAAAGCGSRVAPPAPPKESPPARLSEYGFFRGKPADHVPVDGVVPYDLNTPLFSDYTEKYRFVRLPKGTQAAYHPTDEFAFPVGTILVKTFAYPRDMRDPAKGRRLLETRLLVHEPKGWVGLPYVWNDEQTDATLEIAGGFLDASWIDQDGETRTNNYIIPNVNQCKGCHKVRNKVMTPIGPKARHLNRDFAYAHGKENQLAYWSRAGLLRGAPASDAAPRLAAWDDEQSGTLDERARAWLEINCAHCHNPEGPARNSALDLLASQNEPVKFGVWKAPVAAGLGSGNLRYSIVPGKPDESILAYRIASTHPSVMMPELGKRLVHEEGVALVRDWIASLKDPTGAAATP